MIRAAGSVFSDSSTKLRDYRHDRFGPMCAEPVPEFAQGHIEPGEAQGELAKAAFEKALGNMQALAETAQKSNAEAYEIVSARIKESMVELQDMAAKVGKA